MTRDQIIERLQAHLTKHGTPADQTTFMRATEARLRTVGNGRWMLAPGVDQVS